MRAFALALLLLPGQDGIDELLRGLSDDDPSSRERSGRRVLERWENWSDAELARLRGASEAADADLAGRARDLLGRIAFRRAMGAALLAAEPDLERIARQGTLKERRDLLVRVGERWQEGRVEEPRARALAERAARDRWFPDSLWIAQAVAPLDQEPLRPYAPLVAAVLEDPGAPMRRNAVGALGRMRAREYASAIAVLLGDPEESVAGEAVATLNRMLAVEHFGKIVPLLGRPGLRDGAALALAQTAARGLAGEVEPLLRTADARTRAAAAAVVGGMGAHEHAGAVAALLVSDEVPVLIKAAESLGRMGAVEHGERLARLLAHEDPYVRGAAAQALGRLRDPRFAPAIFPLLRDTITDVRDYAAGALGELLPEDRIAEISGLLTDRDAVVRGLSARALGQAGVRSRAKDITKVLDWEHPWSRGRAIRALGGLGAVEHLDAIIELTRDEWDVVRVASAAALCDLSPLPWPEGRKERALGKLREARKDFGEEAPRAAAVAIVLLGGGDLAAQKEVLDLLDERDAEMIPVLLDGLARLHEKKGRDALDREIAVDGPVDSIERLGEELAEAGLALDLADDPRLAGRIPGGFRTTPRKLLALLWEGTVAVPWNGKVRVLDPMHAREAWAGRLDQLRKR